MGAHLLLGYPAPMLGRRAPERHAPADEAGGTGTRGRQLMRGKMWVMRLTACFPIGTATMMCATVRYAAFEWGPRSNGGRCAPSAGETAAGNRDARRLWGRMPPIRPACFQITARMPPCARPKNRAESLSRSRPANPRVSVWLLLSRLPSVCQIIEALRRCPHYFNHIWKTFERKSYAEPTVVFPLYQSEFLSARCLNDRNPL